jgi:HK97 family phage major capsid protein
LLRRGGERVASTVRNDTLRQMGLAEDQVLLRSPGTVHRPKGLRYWANLANVIAATGGAPTVAGVTQDLGRLMLLLEEANVPLTSPVWSMAPRSKNFLMTLRDGLGNYAFPEIWQGKLFGWPVESTTHMPRNLGSGGNKSEIMLWDADEMALGQGPSLQVAISEEGTFVDASGKTISALQRNLSLLRVISEVDLVARHDLAIGVLTEVGWGL